MSTMYVYRASNYLNDMFISNSTCSVPLILCVFVYICVFLCVGFIFYNSVTIYSYVSHNYFVFLVSQLIDNEYINKTMIGQEGSNYTMFGQNYV